MSARMMAVLLVACGYPPAPAGGIAYTDETQAWRPDVERLIQLQAEALGDDQWPTFYRDRTNITLELHDGPFSCSGVMCDGCTVAEGGYDNGGDPWIHPGAPTWYFIVQLSRQRDLYHTAIGYELGHVYLSAHGIADDDLYDKGRNADFWRRNQEALDRWAATASTGAR